MYKIIGKNPTISIAGGTPHPFASIAIDCGTVDASELSKPPVLSPPRLDDEEFYAAPNRATRRANKRKRWGYGGA